MKFLILIALVMTSTTAMAKKTKTIVCQAAVNKAIVLDLEDADENGKVESAVITLEKAEEFEVTADKAEYTYERKLVPKNDPKNGIEMYGSVSFDDAGTTISTKIVDTVAKSAAHGNEAGDETEVEVSSVRYEKDGYYYDVDCREK